MEWSMDMLISSDELRHHGIKGQKWGVRRFQNKNGSLTAAGKKRYSLKDMFSPIELESRDGRFKIETVGPVPSRITAKSKSGKEFTMHYLDASAYEMIASKKSSKKLSNDNIYNKVEQYIKELEDKKGTKKIK